MIATRKLRCRRRAEMRRSRSRRQRSVEMPREPSLARQLAESTAASAERAESRVVVRLRTGIGSSAEQRLADAMDAMAGSTFL